MTGLIGRKLGMSNIYDADGNRISVTIIQAGPCKVTGIKTVERDGYSAVQLGFGSAKEKRVNKPLKGMFTKAGLPLMSVLKEFRLDSVSEYVVGQDVNVEIFKEGDVVKVSGRSKGKGFQGVMKRHGFGGVGGTTHGQSDRLRAPGSIGSSSYPSRVFPGQRMAGRMGYDNVTVRGLKVIKVLAEKNIVIVKGSIPGAINSIVELYKK